MQKKSPWKNAGKAFITRSVSMNLKCRAIRCAFSKKKKKENEAKH